MPLAITGIHGASEPFEEGGAAGQAPAAENAAAARFFISFGVTSSRCVVIPQRFPDGSITRPC